MVFIEIDLLQSIVVDSRYSKLGIVKRASAKQLFTNHLGLRIISFTNLQIWKKRALLKRWH